MIKQIFSLLTVLWISFPILSKPQSQNNKFVLISNLYNETVQERIEEYKYCIQHNLAHPLIHRIHVLYDTSLDKEDAPSEMLNILEELTSDKIIVTKKIGRQTYSDNFVIANNYYPNTSIIVANADIFFDSSLELLSTVSLEDTFLCLTRWDVTSNGKLKIFTDAGNMPAVYSQDVWIFKTPITIPNILIELGTPGCDNRIAYEMLKLGYDIYNPCIDIRCCHLHLSQVRNYELSQQKYKNMIYIPWCFSTDLEHTT